MKINPGQWCDKTEALISRALATASIQDIKIQVDKCGAVLFELTEGGEIVGAFVLRVDRVGGKNQGVIVAAAAVDASGHDLTAGVLPVIEKMFFGCASVRIHTERVGLARKLSRQGYEAAEIVLTKEL